MLWEIFLPSSAFTHTVCIDADWNQVQALPSHDLMCTTIAIDQHSIAKAGVSEILLFLNFSFLTSYKPIFHTRYLLNNYVNQLFQNK